MTRSFRHRDTKDLIAHYMSPLHLFSPLIKYSCKTRSPKLKKVLRSVVWGYDKIYKVIV